MDEEEKPFPIEFIVILLIVALANDIAEIFFDILDFTGVGVAGEAIMEPINFILDFFFTGIFVWKVGFGGGTVTQYIDDILEPFFIPGRTLSVGLGMWIANHPGSAIGKVATEAASLEGGGVGGTLGEAGGTVEGVGKEAASAEKNIQSKGSNAIASEAESETATGESSASRSGSPENEGGEERKEGSSEKNMFKNPYDNPVGTAGEELDEPPEEEFHEGEGLTQENKPEEEAPPKKVIDITSRQRQRSDEGLANAA